MSGDRETALRSRFVRHLVALAAVPLTLTNDIRDCPKCLAPRAVATAKDGAFEVSTCHECGHIFQERRV